MRPGQRVAVTRTFLNATSLDLGTVVDFPTEDRTRVYLDGHAEPKVFDNLDVDNIPDAVTATVTRLMRLLGETTEDERHHVETQLRRLTGHADLIGFARSLRSAT